MRTAPYPDDLAEEDPVFAWAFDEAPIRTVQELGILSWIAHATDRGYGCRLRTQDFVDKFRLSERTVRRTISELERRGLIERGDERLVQHLPPGHRPMVWDVPFPGRGPRPPFVPTEPAWEGQRPPAAAIAARLSMWAGCWICGGPKQAIDHVKPRARGGPDLLCNYRPACSRCNAVKRHLWEGPRWAHHLAGSKRFGGAP